MKPRLFVLLSFVSVVCCALLSFTVTRVRAQQHGPIPLTAQMTGTYYRYPSGEFVKKEQTIIAIRSDGSRVESRMFTIAGIEGEQKSISDITLKRNVNVDGPTQSVTTYPMTDREVLRARMNALRACDSDSASPHKSLLGYEVVKATLRPGEGRIESWVAPDLGCFVLKRNVYGPSGDAPVTIVEARSIAIGEPDARFFSVPPQYVERSPSEVDAEFLRRYPAGAVPEDPENVRRSDSWYHKLNHLER